MGFVKKPIETYYVLGLNPVKYLNNEIIGWCLYDVGNATFVDAGKLSYKSDDPLERVTGLTEMLLEKIKELTPYKIHICDNFDKLTDKTYITLSCLMGAILGILNTYNLNYEYVDREDWQIPLKIFKNKGFIEKQCVDWVNLKYDLELYFRKDSNRNEHMVAEPMCMISYLYNNFGIEKSKQRNINNPIGRSK